MAIRTRSAGGIVLGAGGTIAMVQHRMSDLWLFPKGHLEEGETDEVAARREIEEETGLQNLEFIGDLGEYERFHIGKDGMDDPEEVKVMHMFLFAAESGATISPANEIGGAKWVPYREVATVIGNEKDRAWYASVFDRVREAIQRD